MYICLRIRWTDAHIEMFGCIYVCVGVWVDVYIPPTEETKLKMFGSPNFTVSP